MGPRAQTGLDPRGSSSSDPASRDLGSGPGRQASCRSRRQDARCLPEPSRSVRPRPSTVQEAAQLAAAARVLELAQGLGLDLADALAGDGELLTDLFQGVVGVHADAEAHAQDALLARGE